MEKKKTEIGNAEESEISGMPRSKDLQHEIIELNILDQQLRGLEEQARLIEQRILEHQMTETSLDEIKNKKNEEAMLPLGSGLFIPGKIESADKVVIHLGSKILAKKSAEEAKKFIQKQKEKLMADGDKINLQMQRILAEMGELEESIRTSRSEIKGKH